MNCKKVLELGKRISNLDCLDLVKTWLLSPTNSAVLGMVPRICLSNRIPGASDAAGPGTNWIREILWAEMRSTGKVAL